MEFTAASLVPFRADFDRARRLYVGYSGGLDSHVLLHALAMVRGPRGITALHINHQLSPHAATWAGHCRQTCADLGVPYVEELVAVMHRGDGRENAAREARYAAFDRYVGQGDLLVLGHHADDQSETILYRLLRGAGPGGLAGMPASRALRTGHLLRPLLGVTRAALQRYASAEGLRWIEDDSNQHLDFDRNYLRHRVIPALAERWPDYAARLTQSAAHCGDADALLRELGELDLRELDQRGERLGWSLDARALAALAGNRRVNVLRHWVAQSGLPSPRRGPLAAVSAELLPARRDSAPLVCWPGGEWRRFRDRLYLLPGNRWRQRASAPVPWTAFPQPLQLADGSTLEACASAGAGLRVAAGQTPMIGVRQGGERCRPAGRSGSNTLKKLLQAHGLEPWLRDRVPLVYVDGELAAVGDLWLCEGFADPAGGWALRWWFPPA